jgi:multiple sugar transport system permease protein
MPLAKGGIAASAILGFIFSWNHFMFSIVLSGNDTRTLPVAVFNFMSFGSVNWGAITAAATIMSVPVILLTLTVQRHIVKGLAIGAVKG